MQNKLAQIFFSPFFVGFIVVIQREDRITPSGSQSS